MRPFILKIRNRISNGNSKFLTTESFSEYNHLEKKTTSELLQITTLGTATLTTIFLVKNLNN